MNHVRTIAALAAALLLTASLAAWMGDDGDAPPPPAAANGETQDPSAPPQAVILRVTRNLEVHGHVELEDDDVIVVRNTRGKLESFAKPRVLQIIRLVSPEPGQEGIVFMRNGQAREGVIVEDAFDQVTIEIQGIRARLRRELVDYVVLKPTFEQSYRDFKATIGLRMHDRHLMLIRWLMEHRRYELAREELLELMQNAEEDVPEAVRLMRVAEAQIALASSSSSSEARESSSESEIKQSAERGRILSREEVNLIRVYEIDFDNPPRVVVRPETIRKMIEHYGTKDAIPSSLAGRQALFRADPLDIVRKLFQLRARELYGEIEVLTEPPSLNLFRQRVHNTWLLQNCATSGCHGGSDAGAFMLHRDGFQDERVRYTNLLILERLEVHPDWPLINYENPEMSLIIQYALPRNVARLPHPDVRGWRAPFRTPEDRMKQDAIRWIESMMQPRPAYPIDFQPPKPERSSVRDTEAMGGRTPR